MAPRGASADDSPERLDESLDPLGRIAARHSEIAEGLVLLRGPDWNELVREVAIGRAEFVERHVPAWAPLLVERLHRHGPGDEVAEMLEREHRIFPQSFEQLEWLLGILERDPHGGNRQALGQYWRLVVEALRRHLHDETDWARQTARTLPAHA